MSAWLVGVRPALADTTPSSTFEGAWRQGPLREEYTVQQWLAACGPPPVTSSQPGGETITVRAEGDDLVFAGGGRSYRTNQCYDPLPTLQRETRTIDAAGRSWRTRCVTPQGDPRRALMQTLVAAPTNDRLELIETGRYEITLKEGRCMADVKRSRTFERIVVAAAPDAAAKAPPPSQTAQAETEAPEPKAGACDTPGEPARLEVRPSRKLLRTGESFGFSATVRDAKGCITRESLTWALANERQASKDGLKVDDSGKVAVAPEAHEGRYEIVVTAAGKSARVTVEVSSPGRYDELLAASGLNAAGESDASSVALIATGTIGGGGATVEDGSGRRRLIFLGVVGACSLLLAGVALVGVRRSRKAAALEREAQARHATRVREVEERRKARAEEHARQMKAHLESVAVAEAESARGATGSSATVCPSCRREFPPGSGFCPFDGNKLAPTATTGDLLAGGSGMICPTCNRGYNPGTKVCAADGDDLVPYALHAARAEQTPQARGKICPTCGARFDGNAGFCGKDGTALVLVN